MLTLPIFFELQNQFKVNLRKYKQMSNFTEESNVMYVWALKKMDVYMKDIDLLQLFP
mgnify:CR=1 FL=1